MADIRALRLLLALAGLGGALTLRFTTYVHAPSMRSMRGRHGRAALSADEGDDGGLFRHAHARARSSVPLE